MAVGSNLTTDIVLSPLDKTVYSCFCRHETGSLPATPRSSTSTLAYIHHHHFTTHPPPSHVHTITIYPPHHPPPLPHVLAIITHPPPSYVHTITPHPQLSSIFIQQLYVSFHFTIFQPNDCTSTWLLNLSEITGKSYTY